jgi:hypothetical protein
VILGADLNVFLDDMVIVTNEVIIESYLVKGDPATARAGRDRISLVHRPAIPSCWLDASAETVSDVDKPDDPMLIGLVLCGGITPIAK